MQTKVTAASELAAPGAETKLEVTALGGFRASVNGRLVEIRSRKAQAIIVYLLLGQAPFEARGRLSGLFWAESPEENARASLRQLLHGLREAFEQHGFQGFSFDRQEVGLDPTAAVLDVSSVLQSAERGRVEPILMTTKRLQDALLPGFDSLDPAFGEWLQIQRQVFADRLERDLSKQLALTNAPDEAIALATALLNLDPTHEEACRKLMSVLAQRGEIGSALKAYKQLWDVLADEYDMEPSPQTQELAVALKSEPSPGSTVVVAADILPPHHAATLGIVAPSPPVVRSERRPIVIAAFTTRGVSAEFSYLVSGFRSDLINKLVRFREWMIIDGTNVDRAPGGRFTQRWEEFLLIEASVFQVNQELKITLNIREEPEGIFVWGDSYQLDLGNWFEIERTLVSRVATVMNLHMSTARLLSSAGQPDVSLDIYDRWLRGQAIIMGWQPERERGRALYQSILTEAPGFSPAYSSLAQLENLEHLALPGVLRTTEREQLALQHAKQAVRLDPFDSRAHLSLGWSSIMNGHFDQAIHRFQTAIELNASDPWTANSAALGLAYCGERRFAAELIGRALAFGLELSNYHWAYQGAIRFLEGDYQKAVEAYEKADNVIGDLAAWKAAALAYLGRDEEAKREARFFIDTISVRWHGAGPPTEEAITAWLLHCFPIHERAQWERLRDGVRHAGLAVPPDSEIPRRPSDTIRSER